MAKPKKKRGFRAIKVENIDFNWSFLGIIDVRPDHQKSNILTVDTGWYDVWDYVNDKENEPPECDPQIITPKFVSESIKFALANGWNVDVPHQEFKLIYRDKKYKVVE